MFQRRRAENLVDCFRDETQWKSLLHAQDCLTDLFDRPNPLQWWKHNGDRHSI